MNFFEEYYYYVSGEFNSFLPTFKGFILVLFPFVFIIALVDTIYHFNFNRK